MLLLLFVVLLYDLEPLIFVTAKNWTYGYCYPCTIGVVVCGLSIVCGGFDYVEDGITLNMSNRKYADLIMIIQIAKYV